MEESLEELNSGLNRADILPVGVNDIDQHNLDFFKPRFKNIVVMQPHRSGGLHVQDVVRARLQIIQMFFEGIFNFI